MILSAKYHKFLNENWVQIPNLLIIFYYKLIRQLYLQNTINQIFALKNIYIFTFLSAYFCINYLFLL